jgi:hypothetical protein
MMAHKKCARDFGARRGAARRGAAKMGAARLSFGAAVYFRSQIS